MNYQPDYQQALLLISHLNNEELKELLNNDDKFENTFQDQFKSMESEKDMLMAQIKSVSDVNLTYEPVVMEGKQKILDLSQKGEELSKIVEEKQQELRNKKGDMTTETALALLQAAAAEMEEESEKIAMEFLDNTLDIEEFLQKFTDSRKIMHLRKVKADKLSELIQRRPPMSSVPNYVNAPPVTLNSNYFPSVPLANPTPYPAYPSIPMPMPGSYFANNF